MDERRAVDVQLLAQVAHVGLQHARVAAEVVLPHVVEDLRAGEHAARVEHQVAQQPVLRGGQLDRRAGARDLARVLVELEVLEAQARGLRLGSARAPQHVAHARQQLLEAERLGDVVVAARGQPAQLVVGRVARGEEDDRCRRPLGAQPPGDLEALHVGQHHVEHDEVGAERVHRRERARAGAGRLHVIAVEAQGHRDDVDDVRLVVDDQHTVRGGHAAHTFLSIGADPWSCLGTPAGSVPGMRAPFMLDLHLPNFNYPDTTPDTLFEKLVDIARTAEDSGFSSVSVMDHLHQIPGVGPRTNWMLEGNTILSALAARTSKVNLGLLVGGVMYRNPALQAKITTTLDIISGGRAVFGLGAAWFEEEHKAYGFDFPPLKERFERLEDALRIARAMFTEEEPTVEGRHYTVRDILNNPKPIRGDIPILVGGSGERKTLRLVAQYADGCNVFGDVERVRHLMDVLQRHCQDVRRDPGEITKTRNGVVFIARTHDEAAAKFERAKQAGLPEDRQKMAIVGGPDEVAEQAQAYLDAGLDGLTFSLPDVHDLETVALAGETFGAVIGTRA